jgi:ferredoxin
LYKFVRYYDFTYLCRVKKISNNQFLQTIKLKKIMAYVISKDDCQACGTCKDECPQEAIMEGDVYTIDADKCVECGACADACPCGAIKLG